MKPVLFVGGLGKSLERAENLHAIYEAYHGPKKFISSHDYGYVNIVESGYYDLMVTDVFPEFTPGKVIMIWHAIQGGKTIGLDQPNSFFRPDMAKLIDCIVVAGRGGVDMFHQCTGVPKERIHNLGMPRTDRYIGKKKGDGGTVLAGKRAYLYVPTFRNWREDPIPPIDFEAIDEELHDDEILAVKAHPYGMAFGVHGYKHVIEVDRMEPTAPWLYDADVVITDYSSIMFDAWLLNKPVVLFEKVKGYIEDRGMYLKYPVQYCPRYANKETGAVLLARGAKQLLQTEMMCMDLVADMCDGHSCERICKLIDEMNKQK